MNNTEFYFHQIVTQHTAMLKNMKACLQKAVIYAQEKKFEADTLLTDRLAPDMFPLVKQVQIAADLAKFGAARLSGQQAPAFEDNEKTMSELMARLDKTIDYLGTFKKEDFSACEEKVASFSWMPGKGLKGKDYFYSFVVPNLYFHASMTYAILRTNGVNLGKADFLGDLNYINV